MSFQIMSTRERQKRWSMSFPWNTVDYKVVGTTLLTVGGSRDGIIRIKTNHIEVQKDDVLGFQYSGYDNPVIRLKTEHDWDVLTNIISDNMLEAGNTLRTSYIETHERAYAILALYSNPLNLVPSAPYLDKSYYGVGNFTYAVHVKNAISHSTSAILVHFQKRVNGLVIFVHSVLRPTAGRNNSYNCYLESSSSHTFLAAIKQGTDPSLFVDYYNTSDNMPFTPDCPREFRDECVIHFPSRNAQFVAVRYNASSVTPVHQPIPVMFNVSNKISWKFVFLNIHIQQRVHGLQINMTSQNFMVNQKVNFHMSLESGSHIRFRWDFSDDSQAENGEWVTHLFRVAGHHIINGSACNEINCVDTTVEILVWNEARANNWIVDKYSGVYQDEDLDINVTLQASHWSKVNICAFYGDGDHDDVTYKTETRSLVRHRFTHAYSSSGEYKLVISIIDQLTQRTINIRESVTVCKRYFNATINSSKYLAVLNKQRFDAFLGEHRLGMEYLWKFGDGSSVVSTSEPYAYHTYKTTGTFVVSVVTRSCAGTLSESTLVNVQETITGLALDCEVTVLINEKLNVNVSYASGTDVLVEVFNGFISKKISKATQIQHLQYVYGTNGTYNITVTAWNMVSESTISKMVYVYSSSSFDVVDILDGDTVVLGEPTEFTAVVLYPDPLRLSYTWQFGDGTNTTTGRSTSHTYITRGTYLASVTVSQKSKNKSFTKYIQVQERLQNLSLYTITSLSLNKGKDI